MNDLTLDNIKTECLRIEEDTIHSAKRHFNASDIWSWVHYFIGIPMTICAAWAGVDAFSAAPQWSGYLALATAALGALQTFMNPSGRSSEHKSCGDEYLALRNGTRLFREIELDGIEIGQAVKRVRELSGARDNLNGISPSTPGIAFWLAKRGVDKGQTQYRADIKEE